MATKSDAKLREEAHAENAPAPDILNRPTIAPDPFDLDNLVVDQNYVQAAGVKKLLTTIPIRKPHPQDFVRVHPDPAYRKQLALIERREEREMFLIPKPMAAELSGEFRHRHGLHGNKPARCPLFLACPAARRRRKDPGMAPLAYGSGGEGHDQMDTGKG